jgi:uncharacterized membrane protein YebE (DUF533 family)
MNKPISTMMHGVLDYITGPTLLVLPRALGWSERITTVLSTAGLGVLGYSVLTRYELGLLRVLPMKVHLGLDIASGAMLAASPFVLLKNRERTITTVATLVGLGVYEIAAGLLTQTQSPIEQAGGEVEIDIMRSLDQLQPTSVS